MTDRIEGAATVLAVALEDVFVAEASTGNVADALFSISVALHRIANELQKQRLARE